MLHTDTRKICASVNEFLSFRKGFTQHQVKEKAMDIRNITPEDQPWIRDLLSEHFASPRIVSRGILHQADELPGLVALQDGTPIGILLYDFRSDQCEVVVLIALQEGQGVATALLDMVKQVAIAAACQRLSLITTNDNVPAIHFYERRGLMKVVTHYGAVGESRGLKPELPEIGRDGIPIRDEIEFELRLCPDKA